MARYLVNVARVITTVIEVETTRDPTELDQDDWTELAEEAVQVDGDEWDSAGEWSAIAVTRETATDVIDVAKFEPDFS
jgi:hypothetical protein